MTDIDWSYGYAPDSKNGVRWDGDHCCVIVQFRKADGSVALTAAEAQYAVVGWACAKYTKGAEPEIAVSDWVYVRVGVGKDGHILFRDADPVPGGAKILALALRDKAFRLVYANHRVWKGR